MAYSAKLDNKEFVVLDGAAGNWYDFVRMPVFSHDSKHMAYVAVQEKKSFIILDHIESIPYDGIIKGDPVFSPDGKHIAFKVVSHDLKSFVVTAVIPSTTSVFYKFINFWSIYSLFGLIENAYEERAYPIGPSLCFSPDGKYKAYAAERNKNWFMVIDGKEKSKYEMVRTPIFSPDSKHVVYTAKYSKRWYLVLDEVKRAWYDLLILSPGQFDSVNSFHFIALENREFFLIQVDIKTASK
jgi:hypothetical protein